MNSILTLVPNFLIGIGMLCGAASAMADTRAEALYTSLDGPESNLSFLDPRTGTPRVGVAVSEKEITGLFCRRSVVVAPGAQPNFACYTEMNYTPDQMKGFYNKLRVVETRLDAVDSASGQRPIGAPTILEKSGTGYLCQKRLAIVPKPVPEFSCYRDLSLVK